MPAPTDDIRESCLLDLAMAGLNTRLTTSNYAIATLGQSGNTIEDVFSAESSYYSRVNYAISWTWDPTNNRATFSVDFDFVASGGVLQFDGGALIYDASPNAPILFDDTGFDSSTDIITVSGHGLSSGDLVIISPESGSTMPTGLTADVAKYVGSVTSTTFRLFDDAALTMLVDFTDNGTGNFFLKNSTGFVLQTFSFPLENVADTVSKPMRVEGVVPLVSFGTVGI